MLSERCYVHAYTHEMLAALKTQRNLSFRSVLLQLAVTHVNRQADTFKELKTRERTCEVQILHTKIKETVECDDKNARYVFDFFQK